MTNAIFLGWNRSIPGREHVSAAEFQDFVQYLGGLQQSGVIQSFDVVFLDPHGGDMNGFFLLRGESGKLHELAASADWLTWQMRGILHLQGFGAVFAATGDAVMERMRVWTSRLPS